MPCRLVTATIHPHIDSHIDLKVNVVACSNLIGPVIPIVRMLQTLLATLVLDLTPRWTLLANLIYHPEAIPVDVPKIYFPE